MTFAVLVPALLAGALPAHADRARAADPEKPEPPRQMSTVGGELLGRPGTQMRPLAGQDAPKLPKGVTARAWIVADAESGDVLAARNAHWRLPPASTMKMLFADTLLPKFDKQAHRLVLPEDLAGMGPGSSAVGVKEDYSYRVHDLWNGVFLSSGNDAVHVLAAMNGGMAETVRQMNEHAHALGADDTRVVSPDGYDADGQTSSAYDLTLIARSGMQKPDFRAYAATVRAEFPGGGTEKKRKHFQIQSTNRLLTGDWGLEPYEGLAGVKNGYTSNAGFTFTGVAERGERTLLVTVLHPDKDEGRNQVYKEAAKLLDWGFAASGRVDPVGELVAPADVREARARDARKDGRDGDARQGSGAPPGPAEQNLASGPRESGGVGTALGLAGAFLVVLGAVGLLVRRQWPTPAAVTRRTPSSRPRRDRP
ncbi:D-alanyl-D-alanine carboxypeptidase [Streptomyces sp. 549]|uniref:D-alanyl-D-alanine carboxypeptidase family protein n=1 Tax=Streptomyces sp. 549 TaxID=3049076 RepID=UPI0024C32D08|nr:D-alanyl-D-alanine carboxypeptidase [Streptomyces sp. 549]MDK1472757.1 D-alanyl-D-alanine carboxypeptidase [Streptomyces sp. 549]